ncbi:MAG: hypothetical protein F6J95_020360 [Leptolyngbya sp. SIO1E4]|nr:hypothetical protein [Leptolyngbya sp. SIO1E4]
MPSPSAAVARSRRAAFRTSAPHPPPRSVPSARQQGNRFLALEQRLSSVTGSDRSATLPPLPSQPERAEVGKAFSYRDLNRRLTGRAASASRPFQTTVSAAFAHLHPEPSLEHPELPRDQSPLPPLPDSLSPPASPASDVAAMSRSYQTLKQKLPPRSSIQVRDTDLDLPDLALDSGGNSQKEQRLPRNAALSSSFAAGHVRPIPPHPSQQSPQPEVSVSDRPEQEPAFSYRALAVSLQRRKTITPAATSEDASISEDSIEREAGAIALETLSQGDAPDGYDPEASTSETIIPEVLTATTTVPSAIKSPPTAQSVDKENAIDVTFSAVPETGAIAAPAVRSQGFSPDAVKFTAQVDSS